MLRTPYFWGGLLLFSLLYFAVTGFDNPVVTVIWSLLTGILALMFLELPAVDESASGTASILAASSVVVGSVLKALTDQGTSAYWDAGAVPIAAFSAWGFDVLRSWKQSLQCFLCKDPVSPGQSFDCPRCGQVVCVKPTCWSGRHLRCTSCLEREVVLFPVRDDWWREQLGARVHRGACDSCYKEAHEADLRECPQCPLLMCRRCWDYHNGRCTRCNWHVRDLPRALWPYMRSVPSKQRTRSRDTFGRETRRRSRRERE